MAAFRFRMPGEIENLDDSVPRDLTAKQFDHKLWADVSCLAAVHRFDGSLEFVGAFAHASIISTRSRTVQNVCVTPAALAGVQRTAAVVLTNCSSRSARRQRPWTGRSGVGEFWTLDDGKKSPKRLGLLELDGNKLVDKLADKTSASGTTRLGHLN